MLYSLTGPTPPHTLHINTITVIASKLNLIKKNSNHKKAFLIRQCELKSLIQLKLICHVNFFLPKEIALLPLRGPDP